MATNSRIYPEGWDYSNEYGVNATPQGIYPLGQSPLQPQQAQSPNALGLGSAAIGAISPVAGIGLGIAGFVQDKIEARKADEAQRAEIDRLRNEREFARSRYIPEMDQQRARTNMIQRGQVANTPAYQSMMSNLSKQYANTSQLATDQMEKQGLGDKSGLSAQIASQNVSQLGNAATMGAANQMASLGNAYGGLSPYAMTTAPERTNYARQQGIYNEAADYGSNLAPIFQLGNTATKYTIGDTYRQQLRDDVAQGFGLGKSGGNV